MYRDTYAHVRIIVYVRGTIFVSHYTPVYHSRWTRKYEDYEYTMREQRDHGQWIPRKRKVRLNGNSGRVAGPYFKEPLSIFTPTHLSILSYKWGSGLRTPLFRNNHVLDSLALWVQSEHLHPRWILKKISRRKLVKKFRDIILIAFNQMGNRDTALKGAENLSNNSSLRLKTWFSFLHFDSFHTHIL